VADTQGATVEQIGQTPICTPSGHVVPIASVVKFRRATAPQQISHIEEMGAVTLSVTPKTGVPLEDTMEELDTAVVAPLRADGRIAPDVITALAGTADKLTQTQHALIGDFGGTVQHPRLLGLSVHLSSAVLVVSALIVVVVIALLHSLRGAVTAVLVFLALFIAGFLVINPTFALAVFQSRVILALLVTYLLMSALFESFAYPFVIMLSVPLAVVGGFACLRIVHEVTLYDVTAPIQQLDVLTMLGFVILIRIVVNNAILIVHQSLNFMRLEGKEPLTAVTLAVRVRTRPIFMAAFTTMFGLLPLVVMPGAGSELYRGLGSVVLGGLLVSTVFTLVLVPAMFALFLDLQRWLKTAPQPSKAVETTPPIADVAPAPGSTQV